MSPKNSLAGGKFASSHTSIIEAAYAPVQAAARLDCVSKISLGVIKRIPVTQQPSIKFMDDSPGSLLAKVRARASIQEIRMYTTDKERLMAAMRAAFSA
jgi:hypothetical protein